MPAKDKLPEETNYQDTGCILHPSCLNCPREVCKFEDPSYQYQNEVNKESRNRAIELRQQGYTIKHITRLMNISQRTLYRWLSHHRSLNHAHESYGS